MTTSPYAKGRKAVVIHEDDVGMTHGSNVAFRELSARGVVTSGSVMAPCPWFPETAAMAAADPTLDLGVHLTLNSEMKAMKWRPLTAPPQSAGLTDELGYFWSDRRPEWRRAQPEAVEAELRAQIEAVRRAGIDITHLDAHCGAAMSTRFLPIYRRLGEDYDLPVVLMRHVTGGNPRPPGQPATSPAFDRVVEEAVAREDPVFDLFFETPWDRTRDAKDVYREALAAVPEGLTFFAFHFSAPGDVEAVDTESSRFRFRTDEYALFSSGRIEPMLKEFGITPIGMREIRDERRARLAA